MWKSIGDIQPGLALPLFHIKDCKHLNAWVKTTDIIFFLDGVTFPVSCCKQEWLQAEIVEKALKSGTFWRKEVSPASSRDNRFTSEGATGIVSLTFSVLTQASLWRLLLYFKPPVRSYQRYIYPPQKDGCLPNNHHLHPSDMMKPLVLLRNIH